MIVTTYRIPYKLGQTVKIKPIFDVHLGSSYCDVSAFKKYLVDSDPDTYFLGGGDLLDSIIIGDKRYEKHADSTTGAIVDDQVALACEYLRPYAKKIIGLGRGNHEDVIIRNCGTDPINSVCTNLGVPYLGYSGFVKLILSESNKSRSRTVVIKWHHGWGGGSRTQGADITKFAKDTAYWDADLFLYGHTHKLQWDVTQRLGLSGEKLIARPKLFAICGTFLKTFSNTTDATYSERAGYPPTTIGGLTVNIKPTQNWVDMWI
ncbi:MAG: hypothetical protein DRJ50_12420 [Actinobacteria bacterium]|nr:MAG: hypothetical protein DRJ50_12420 [Actinomycetota bacterium]